MIGFGVAVVDELHVIRVGADRMAGMLDGAPILLCAPADLSDVTDQSVGVGAVGAVQFLQGIEVCEMMPVENNGRRAGLGMP